jgi:hypothetical protein
LARIDGRADRSACLDALPRDLIFDKRWLSALRARDPAEP